jgi:hypothetical protein
VGDGETEEVEAAGFALMVMHESIGGGERGKETYPMLIMIRMLETATARFVIISCQPSFMSK